MLLCFWKCCARRFPNLASMALGTSFSGPESCGAWKQGAKMLSLFFFLSSLSQVVAGEACSRRDLSYLSYIQQQPAEPAVRCPVFIFTSICFIAHSCVKYNRDAKLQPPSVCLCILRLPLFILNWSGSRGLGQQHEGPPRSCEDPQKHI